MLTIRELIKTLYNAFNQKFKNYRSNWEQNDPTAEGYIKNRPFYTDGIKEIETTLVPEISVDVEDGSSVYDPFSISFTEGKTYTIVWDGATYKCTAYIASGPNTPSIGNGEIGNAGGGNGEPFFCTVYNGKVMLFASEDGSHTISISGSETKENIHSLDLKYLSGNDTDPHQQLITDENGNAKWEERLAYVEYQKRVLLSETTIITENNYASLFDYDMQFDRISDNMPEFIITFDRVEYKCDLIKDGYMYYLGNMPLGNYGEEDTGEPFVIDINAYRMFQGICTKIDGAHTLSITELQPTYHTLSEKYLPPLVGRPGTGEFAEVFNIHDEDYRGDNIATGKYSHAEGVNTTAHGNASHAEGDSSIAIGHESHAEGDNNIAHGNTSHAEGFYTVAYGEHSHAEGAGNNDSYTIEITGAANATTYTVSSSYMSLVVVNNIIKYGRNSAARITSVQGYTITVDHTLSSEAVESATAYLRISGNAIGAYSHSEGHYNKAIGQSSHAEGEYTNAIGNYSHSEGYYTKASSDYQHVQGKYNIEDSGDKYAHIVGNGTSYNDFSNAHTLDWSGNGWFAGDVYVGGTGQDDPSAERLVKMSEVTATKDSIRLIDQVNGYTYIACMREGNFVTYCATKSIEITSMPAKTEYVAGDYFDLTGMVVTLTAYDGTTREITNYNYPTNRLAEGTTTIEITYVEAGVTHTATVPVTVNPFDAATVLVDFGYTDNGDGTYTITSWKGTHNGATSTEMIIPDYECIIV